MSHTLLDRAVSDILSKSAPPASRAPAASRRPARADEPAVCPMGSRPAAEPRAASPATAAAPAGAARFMASSRFVVRNGMQDQVREAFRTRPHAVDGAPGFCRMEVLCPIDAPEEFWLMTWWTDEASFAAWHYSHLYRESHAGIPKGLKLVAKSVQIRRLELVAE